MGPQVGLCGGGEGSPEPSRVVSPPSAVPVPVPPIGVCPATLEVPASVQDALQKERHVCSILFAARDTPSARTVSSVTAPILRPGSREHPFPQPTFRVDGKNVRDGAGLGSPAFWFPSRYSFEDRASDFRSCIDRAVDSFPIASILSSLESACVQPSVEDSSLDTETLLSQLRCEAERCAKTVMDSFPSDFPGLNKLDICPGQPFRLHFLAAFASLLEDPDALYPLRGVEGWHLGSERPVDDSGLWPLKKRKKDESEFGDDPPDYKLWSENYRSFSEHKALAMKKLQADLDQDFAEKPGSWANLCSRLGLPPDTPEPAASDKKGLLLGPPGMASARLGAVPQGSSVRVVVDGTIGGVNDACNLPETQQTPGLADVVSGLDPLLPSWVALKYDVKSAYKRLKLQRQEWKRAIFCIDGQWYFYKVLPFGLKASGFWWNRFNALVHRCLHSLCMDVPHGGFVYVDDSLWLVERSNVRRVFARIFVFLAILGMPLSWEKTHLGEKVDWVGFLVDLSERRVALTDEKRARLETRLSSALDSKALHLSELQSLGGFMSWASSVVPTTRPLLWPIFRAIFIASNDKRQMYYDVQLLQYAVSMWRRIVLCARSFIPRSLRTISSACIRVDACADANGAWLGGWFLPACDAPWSELRWFACRVPIGLFPEQKSRTQSYISACEMLAISLGVRLWAPLIASTGASLVRVNSDSMVSVLSCSADYARSINVSFALRELVSIELEVNLAVTVSHIAGESNFLADAISRRFSWIWHFLPLANQEHVSLELLIPFALSVARTGSHDPYVGICIGNAKNPGPGDSFSQRLLQYGFSPEDVLAFERWLGLSEVQAFLAVTPISRRSVSQVLLSWTPESTPGVPLSRARLAVAALLRGETIATQPPQRTLPTEGMQAPKMPPAHLRMRGVAAGASTATPTVDSGPPPKVRAIVDWASPALGTPPATSLAIPGIKVRQTSLAAKAVAIASNPTRLSSAVSDLRAAYFADSTWRSHASEVRLYLRLCAAVSPRISPWPITLASLEVLISAMLEAGYSSIQQYVTAVRRHQTLLRLTSDPREQFLLERELPMMLRASRRGQGEPRHMEPLSELHLARIQAVVRTTTDHFTWDLVILEWFFLLRSAEVLNVSPNDVTFILSGDISLPGRVAAAELGVASFSAQDVSFGISPPGETRRFRVRLQIRKDKINQQGRDIHRFLDCVCMAPFRRLVVPFCPVHCAARLLLRHRGSTHSKCDPGLGLDPPSASRYLACLRSLITDAGIRRTDLFAGEMIERFGTHSLRRGGAQALAMGGWSLDAIKFFGRWLSNAIELYLLDIPFKTDGHKLASSMVPNRQIVGETSDQAVVRSLTIRPLSVGALLKVLLPAPLEVAPLLGLPYADPSACGDSGWFEVRILRLSGDILDGPPPVPAFALWRSPLDTDLRSMLPSERCPPNCCVVVPASAQACAQALCFDLTAFTWMRL